jgi:hypothetical protein
MKERKADQTTLHVESLRVDDGSGFIEEFGLLFVRCSFFRGLTAPKRK